ncbi:hypothetical protein [Streptomyces sp. NPDC020917]|uniref:hypothetical protein n=1 Tax=Streptomyces sp. NPDC020917 TaxID=3365102 RepID=UPI003799EBD0
MSMPQMPAAGVPAPSDVLTVLSPPADLARRRARSNAIPLVLAAGLLAYVALAAADLMPGSRVDGRLWGVLSLAGLLAGSWLPHLVLRVLAGPAGLAPIRVSVGVGHWGGSRVRRGQLVAFRQVPLFPVTWQLALTGPEVGLTRLRAASAVALLVPAGGAAALLAAGGPAAAAGSSCAAVVLFQVAVGMLTRHAIVAVLFHSASGGLRERFAELRHGPAELAAARALAAGRVTAAREALAEPCEAPDPTRLMLEATLDLAEGHVEPAARQALLLYRQSLVGPRQAAAMRIYAQALAQGIAAGRWTEEEAGPALDAAVSTLRAYAPPMLKASELPAVQARRQGRTHAAVALARRGAALAPEAFTRARVLVVLAELLDSVGNADEARDALRQSQHLIA